MVEEYRIDSTATVVSVAESIREICKKEGYAYDRKVQVEKIGAMPMNRDNEACCFSRVQSLMQAMHSRSSKIVGSGCSKSTLEHKREPDDKDKGKMIEECLVTENPKKMSCNCVQLIDGVAKCTLCDNCATEGHLTSNKRMDEHCLGPLMLGQAHTTRQFRREKCRSCSISKIQQFGGDALLELPLAAQLRIHMEKGVIYHGEKGQLTPEEAQYELGSYPGTGKYIPFHELPDAEIVATPEQLQSMSPPGQGCSGL